METNPASPIYDWADDPGAFPPPYSGPFGFPVTTIRSDGTATTHLAPLVIEGSDYRDDPRELMRRGLLSHLALAAVLTFAFIAGALSTFESVWAVVACIGVGLLFTVGAAMTLRVVRALSS